MLHAGEAMGRRAMSGSAVPAAAVLPVEVVESRPARIRRPLDLVRLVGLVAGLAVLVALAVVARDAGRGADADIARLVGRVPAFFRSALRLVSAFGALAFPVALMVREVLRGNRRSLLEALLTGFLAIGITQGINAVLTAFPSGALYGALAAPSDAAAARPLDTYLAALFAFATVIGIAEDRPWRRLLGGVTAVYVLSAVASTSATLLSLLISPVLGMLVGIAVRYAAGSVNESPDGARIAAALARQGFPLARIEQVRADQTDHRAFRATASSGALLDVQVFDRELITSGAAYKLYRIVRLRAELAPAPALSLERVTEHRSLLALAAQALGVRTPRLLAGLPC